MFSNAILVLILVIFAVYESEIQVSGFLPITEPVVTKEYKGIKYHYFENPKLNWIKSHLKCAEHGLQLVDIPSKDHVDWVVKEFLDPINNKSDTSGVVGTWTSLNDLLRHGNITDLYTGEERTHLIDPKAIHEKENCVRLEFRAQFFLNDRVCTPESAFICTQPAGRETGDNCKETAPCPECKTGNNPCKECMKEMLAGGEECSN